MAISHGFELKRLGTGTAWNWGTGASTAFLHVFFGLGISSKCTASTFDDQKKCNKPRTLFSITFTSLSILPIPKIHVHLADQCMNNGRHGPSATQFLKPNPTSTVPTSSSPIEFQHQTATFAGIVQSCATSSSLLGTCYTSTRSHFEDAAIRVAALWRSKETRALLSTYNYRRYFCGWVRIHTSVHLVAFLFSFLLPFSAHLSY